MVCVLNRASRTVWSSAPFIIGGGKPAALAIEFLRLRWSVRCSIFLQYTVALPIPSGLVTSNSYSGSGSISIFLKLVNTGYDPLDPASIPNCFLTHIPFLQ